MIPSNSKSWQYNASHGILRTATRRSAFGPRKPDTSRAIHSRFKLQVPPKSVQSILVWNSQSWQYNASRAWPQHSLASMDHVHLSVAQLDLISSPRVGFSPFCPRARALLPAGLLAGAGNGFVSVAIMDGSDEQALRKTPQQRYRGRRPAALARGSEHDQGLLGRDT